MAITPTFTLVNTAGMDQAVVDQFQAVTAAAIANWGAALAGDAAVSVRIEFSGDTSGHTLEARWGNGLIVQQNTDFGYVIGGATADLQGAVGRLATDADIWIKVDPVYISGELFLDATPQTRDDVPLDRTDGLSVVMQAVGHALGFSGYFNETDSTYAYNLKTAYDARLVVTNGAVTFDGPNVRAVLGNAVPLTPGAYRGYGTTDGDPATSGDLLLGLMNGVAYHRGYGYTISDLDLAFMADMGIGTTRDDILNLAWSPAMHGGAGNDTISGGNFDNILTGDAGNDIVRGRAGNDRLEGGADNDTLDGGRGNDVMFGGSGDDTYFVDAAADEVYETLTRKPTDANDAGGTDTISSSVAFSLAARNGTRFVENLTLTGNGDSTGTGNGLANVITGNGGNNMLSGGAGDDVLRGLGGNDKLSGGDGRDTLIGGAGADQFVFAVPATEAAMRDRIADFSHAEGDLIRLKQAAFAGIGHTGALTAAEFHAAAGVSQAHDASDRIIYNTATGELWYDADGTGAAAQAVQVALLTRHPDLVAGDILIFA
ncbi:calcium-binding protein [Novosphingobium sp. PASSN1]|uniref:calcium-binding protein n=1 Tax=Novosphingobium sp. PASSN1 TaxID=2015561 RepID=UPI0025DE8AAB|nr:calcium-binding protein [Novosphingobium sp. PASSN1]